MRWKGRRQSDQIEDRTGQPARGGAGAVAGGGIGIFVLALIVMALGGDPGAILSGSGGGIAVAPPQTQIDPAKESEYKEYVGVVLADTEEVFSKLFAEEGKTYEKPRLVLFTGAVDSACGTASSAVGPFYCGGDKTIYLDVSFFDELGSRFGASGDFAPAYVIAHEVGHHVQNLQGTLDQVNNYRRRASEREANAASVRLELQADYYAGLWAHHAKSIASLDRADIEEAMTAANAIGDDTLQRQAQGQVVPDSFTHGTSEQRMKWFLKGFQSGTMKGGNTFDVDRL